jgi:hypothetical protein
MATVAADAAASSVAIPTCEPPAVLLTQRLTAAQYRRSPQAIAAGDCQGRRLGDLCHAVDGERTFDTRLGIDDRDAEQRIAEQKALTSSDGDARVQIENVTALN